MPFVRRFAVLDEEASPAGRRISACERHRDGGCQASTAIRHFLLRRQWRCRRARALALAGRAKQERTGHSESHGNDPALRASGFSSPERRAVLLAGEAAEVSRAAWNPGREQVIARCRKRFSVISLR